MSQQSDIVDNLTAVTEPLAASLGLTLWGVEVLFGPRSLVRIYVEGQEGVSVEQCANLSRLLGLTLEVEDVVPGPYVLEVSSPGIERVFFSADQLASFAGERVEITLRGSLAEFPGRKKFWGIVTKAEGEGFSLAAEEVARPGEALPLVNFTFEEVRKAKLMLALPEKNLPGKKKSAGKRPAANAAGVEPQSDIDPDSQSVEQ